MKRWPEELRVMLSNSSTPKSTRNDQHSTYRFHISPLCLYLVLFSVSRLHFCTFKHLRITTHLLRGTTVPTHHVLGLVPLIYDFCMRHDHMQVLYILQPSGSLSIAWETHGQHEYSPHSSPPRKERTPCLTKMQRHTNIMESLRIDDVCSAGSFLIEVCCLVISCGRSIRVAGWLRCLHCVTSWRREFYQVNEGIKSSFSMID
jgi:hypothetical protein